MELKSEKIKKDIFGIKITANQDGQVLGWAQLYIISNERHEEPYAFLENVYIEQEFRKQGLGSKLILAAIEEANKQGCYKIIGTSRMPKEEVHKFYLKHGFTKWGFEFRMDLRASKPKQRD